MTPPAFISAFADQIGETDCETIGDGFLAQPANTISSATYIVFGVWLVAHALRTRGEETATQVTYGVALAGVGVGSILFHGPMPPGARLVHDLTIASVFVLIAVRAVATLRQWDTTAVIGIFAAATALIGVVMAASPEGGIALSAVVGIVALGLEAYLHKTGRREPFSSRLVGWIATILALLLAGLLINILGRTSGPLCDPDSLYQGHAAWHVLTAAAFGLYGHRAFVSSERGAVRA